MISLLTNLITIDLTRNPTPAEPKPAPIARVPDWKHARAYRAKHAELEAFVASKRAETYGEGGA